MDVKDFLPVVAAFLSGGLVAAVVTFILNRRKTDAEIESMKAATEISRLNARKLESELRDVEKTQEGQQNDLKKLNDVTNELLNNLAIFRLAGYMYGHLQQVCLVLLVHRQQLILQLIQYIQLPVPMLMAVPILLQ